MQKFAMCCLVAALTLSGSSSTRAEGDSDRVKAIQQKLDQMAAEVAALNEQMQELKAQRLAEAVDKKVVEEQDKILLSLEWKDGFKMASPDGRFKFQVQGRLQIDGYFGLDRDDPLTDTFFVRRAYVGVGGTAHRHYDWFIQTNFAGGRATVEDAWLKLKHLAPHANLLVGQWLLPFGMEAVTSNKYVKPIERSMIISHVAPFYDAGAELSGSLFEKRVQYWVGISNGAGINRRDGDSDKDVVGRLVLRPFAPDDSVLKGLQFGAAITHGHQGSAGLGGSGPSTAVGTRIWTYRPGVVSNGERTRVGLEAAYHLGPFGLTAEYIVMARDTALAGVGRATIDTRGWYVTATYLLTGETVGFGRVHPTNPWEPGTEGSGLGALELVGRLGQIELDGQRYVTADSATRATQLMVGFNWYPTSMTKIALQWQHAEFNADIGSSADDSEDSLMLRFQIEY